MISNNRKSRMYSANAKRAGLAVLFFLTSGALLYPPQYSHAMDSAVKAGVIPHKALYDVKLSTRKNSARVSNIEGQMMYEWRLGCDGWLSDNHSDMTYEYLELPPVRIKSEFSTFESFDGKTFTYTSQRKREDKVYEEFRGSVNRENMSQESTAVYSIPKDLTISLPEKTYFPMAHTISVLEKIKAGKKFYNATIFDGGDDEGPVDINTFIVSKANFVPQENVKDKIDENLIKDTNWNVRLAFFPKSSTEATADYEMSLVFHENGVISDMDIDYGDFSVKQKLIALEEITEGCESQKEEKNKGK